MKFIFNFIFFGVLFYLIYVYFPEPFHTLVSWAESIVNFFKDMFHLLMEKIGSATHSSPPPSSSPPA